MGFRDLAADMFFSVPWEALGMPDSAAYFYGFKLKYLSSIQRLGSKGIVGVRRCN